MARFGSLFFVIEMKGSKAWTKQVLKSKESNIGGFSANTWDDEDVKSCFSEVYDKLERTVPHLDWSRMRDRNEGELLIDMAMTFGGVAEEGEASVVGLPRLAKLEASSAQSRFLAGQCHPMASLDQFGAIQCETSAIVAEKSHIAYRLTYPLVYEVARKADNSRASFEPTEVFARSDQHHEEIQALTTIFSSKNVVSTSYGVRLEFRMGAMGFFECLQYLAAKVRIALCSAVLNIKY